MGSVWKRHPRYSIFLVFLLLAICFVLIPSAPYVPSYNHVAFEDTTPNVQQRFALSEAIYEKALMDRKALLRRFGPLPEDVETFPDHDKPYTIWNFFPAAFNCPYEVRHLGTLADGGKWVCGLSRLERQPDCIIYSFGISGDSTFEAELLQNTKHCHVWGYDFSVKGFTNDIPEAERWRTTFHAFGLAGSDRPATSNEPAMYSLQSLMAMNGHDHIDLLKIDIEGWEFETLEELIKPYLISGEPLPFAQLQLEIHVWDKSFASFMKWWEMLEAAGLRPFWTEPNLVYVDYAKATPSLTEYSFINIKGDNVLTQPAMTRRLPPPRHPHGP
ncbi:methyltransferase domain-containing protein [Lentinula raphanica]|nr:methyltransferase domain-containing protein [Lentinula raphanica]